MPRIKALVFLTVICSVFRAQSPVEFTVHTISPSNSITCVQQAVNFIAASYKANLTYTWMSQNAVFFGSNVSINIPGTYTVLALEYAGQISSTTIQVAIDITPPVSFLTPNTQTISCNTTSLAQVNATGNAASNPSHSFISPSGGVFVVNSSTASYKPTSPGTYTHELVNTINGCKTVKTFTVTSLSGFPTFNLESPTSFTLGCGSTSSGAISLDNGNTTPPGGQISYTLVGPQTSTTIVSGVLSGINIYTVNTPGQYTAVIRDNATLCETRTAFSVIQNTATPNIKTLVPTQILDCIKSQTTLRVIGPANTTYNWLWQGTPGFIYSDTIHITSPVAIPQSTLVNTYTLIATDNGNMCATETIIPVYQNLFPPKAIIASSPPNVLTCYNPTLILTNQSATGIPPATNFSVNQPVTAAWKPLFQQTSPTLSTTFVVSAPGYYLLEATDQNNGCKNFDTIAVFDGKIYPLVNNPSGPYPFCINAESPAVAIYPLISGNSSGYTYKWSAPQTVSISGVNAPTLSVNAIGIYTVMVTNTISGCSTMGQMIVTNCYTGLFDTKGKTINVSLYPNPSTGLFTIDFENTDKEATLKIFNSIGALVTEEHLALNKNFIDLSRLANGMYSAIILKNNAQVYSTKLLKN